MHRPLGTLRIAVLALAASTALAAAPAPGRPAAPPEQDPVALRAALEREIDEKVTRVLAPLVGADRFVVRTSVEVDLQRVRRVEKSYDPDSAVVVSEQRTKERSPGAEEEGVGGTAERQDRSASYEYSVRELSVEQPIGQLRRLSVVVLLDRRLADPTAGTAPRGVEELARIEELVKGAIGFDEERGDRLAIEQVVFQEPPAGIAGGGFVPRGWHLLVLLGALAALGAIAYLLRGGRLSAAASGAAEPAGSDATALPALAQLDQPAAVEVLRRRLAAVAVEQPQAVAQTLRLWLHERREEG